MEKDSRMRDKRYVRNCESFANKKKRKNKRKKNSFEYSAERVTTMAMVCRLSHEKKALKYTIIVVMK